MLNRMNQAGRNYHQMILREVSKDDASALVDHARQGRSTRWYRLYSSGSALPQGWVQLHCLARAQLRPMSIALFAADEKGSVVKWESRVEACRRTTDIVRLPDRLQGLWLKVGGSTPEMPQIDLTIIEHGPLSISRQALRYGVVEASRANEKMPVILNVIADIVRKRSVRYGIGIWLRRHWTVDMGPADEDIPVDDYQTWIKRYDLLDETDRNAIRQEILELKNGPRFSIIMPLTRESNSSMERTLRSIQEQLYPDWELCISVDNNISLTTKDTLREYAARDPRVRMVADTCESKSHGCEFARRMATGTMIAIVDAGDLLAEDALYLVALACEDRSWGLIYTDEDVWDERFGRTEPKFKSDWNADLFHCCNYLQRMVFYSSKFADRIGGFDPELNEEHEFDFSLRVIEKISPECIHHLPFVLYHRCGSQGTVSDLTVNNGQAESARALEAHFKRTNRNVQVKPLDRGKGIHHIVYPIPVPTPLVTLIIPSTDNAVALRPCIEVLTSRTTYDHYEILVVDSQSRDRETLEYLESLRTSANVRVVECERPFTYAGAVNFAVQHARGPLIGLVDDDTQVISPDWLTEMVRHALRPEIGAVGAKLYYANDTLQHGGIALGIFGVCGHLNRHLPREHDGYLYNAKTVHNLSAITAACFVLRRELFLKVEGLDEINLPSSFCELDLCLKLSAHGFRNLWTPLAELYHLQAGRLGDDYIRSELFLRQVEYMKSRWPDVLRYDPYYNPNLSVWHENVHLAFPPRITKPWR